MIHAYLFVTRNFRDHSDHGPKFKYHMKRINNCAGTNITVRYSNRKNVCVDFPQLSRRSGQLQATLVAMQW